MTNNKNNNNNNNNMICRAPWRPKIQRCWCSYVTHTRR